MRGRTPAWARNVAPQRTNVRIHEADILQDDPIHPIRNIGNSNVPVKIKNLLFLCLECIPDSKGHKRCRCRASFEIRASRIDGLDACTMIVHTVVMQNITFRADKSLIERAREVARQRSTNLNQLFRDWLEEITRDPGRLSSYDRLMERLRDVRSGGTFSRDEMNVR